MKTRWGVLIALIFCFGYSYGQDKQVFLKKADTFIQEQHADSCMYYLSLVTDTTDMSVLFRKKVMSILRGEESDQSDEVVIETMNQIIDEFIDLPFSNLVKVIYLGYYSELMIPDESMKSYNLSIINKALGLFDKSEDKDSLLLMHLLHNKGNILHETKRNFEAISELEKALAIAENIDLKNENMVAILYYNLSNAYNGNHQYQYSYELVEKSEAAFSKLENPNLDYFQSVYLKLFSTSLYFGNLEKAENYLNKSANFYQQNKQAITNGNADAMDRKEIHLLYNYMRLYALTKDLDKAKALIIEAQEKFSDKEDDYFRLRLAAIFNYMGEMYVINEPEKSFQYYQKAIAVFNKKEDLAYGLMFEFNLGKAYLNSKNYMQAHEISKSIIEKGESIKDSRLPFFYFLESKTFLEQGLFDESLPRLHDMISFLNKSESNIDLLTQEGISEFLPKENLNAGYLVSSTAQTIEMHIPNSKETNLVMNSLYHLSIIIFQSTFKQDKFNEKSQGEYEKMLSGLLKTNSYLGQQSISYSEIIRFSENATSRNLWEKFKFKNEGLDLVDQKILSKEQEFRSEITNLKLGIAGMDSTAIAAEIFEKELELERLGLEKRNKFNSFYRYEDFDFDFIAFKSKLSNDQLVLKYEFLDSMLYVYEITVDQVIIKPIDSIQHVNKKLQEFVSLLRSPSSDIDLLHSIAEQLHHLLLPPTLKPEILIVSDKLLNYLPFDLLRKDGKYLIESSVVSNATSLSLLDQSKNNNQIRRSMIMAPSYNQYILNDQQLAVRGAAYNLEGALAEAEAISEIIPSKKYMRAAANKEVFIKEAADFDLLHLSMHSFMNDEDPELSSLVFYDGVNNNELFISELYGMNLKAKLAVLSACNTGVGKEKTGDGMVSVNRAFSYAGVPAIVSSLWSAPDKATKELMTAFYRELKQGKSKSAALRNAKLTYIKTQEVDGLKHPFFWGSFILHGNTEPLKFKGRNMDIRITAIIAVLIFLIGYFLGRKKLVTNKS